ncbi:alpha/beta fold hydrolase [Aspergillus ruber CBS 135680]|uniref:Putative alpha/beta fold family hydrolase n=1 Tax=Aspergillus ruber (strain CBS 135680) TaxID=1388766 RepID=A0A017S3Z6_ASPRC|nr:putative alpha/beta fold family hydrolase [Aspergillus ruber CBS 135680]EYE91667.1 putative alpha/beta fold family hydrolase [Aspergillus ruber CBS 135680]
MKIYYEVHSTIGPTLVLVSGYMGIANIWQPLLAKLGPKYRCITYDNHGFDQSFKPKSPEAYSVPCHAADLGSVIKALGNQIIECFVFIARSMGDNIATAYYHRNPHNVVGIVYTGAYFDGKLVGNFLTYDALTSGIESPSNCVDFYSNMGLDKSIALEAANWLAYARSDDAKALLSFEIGDIYSTIDVLGLIIQGAKDMATPVEGCVRPLQ